MEALLHEEDVLVVNHLPPLRRYWENPRLRVNRRAFGQAIKARQELDVQAAQARGWLPPTDVLLALPALQRARAVDEAGLDADGAAPMDLDAVMRRREEAAAASLAAKLAAAEMARAAEAEAAAARAAAVAAAAEERRQRRLRAAEAKEARQRQRAQEKERRAEEKVLRQTDRLLEKKEEKVRRRAEAERHHAVAVAAWEASVGKARRAAAEAGAAREAAVARLAEAEARLGALQQEKHSMVLQLKQALQAEEEQRQREAALAALEEGEMVPSPPQALGSTPAWASHPWAGLDTAGVGHSMTPGALSGPRGPLSAFPDRSPSFGYAGGLAGAALGAAGLAAAYPHVPLPPPPPPPPARSGSFAGPQGAGAGAQFSPFAAERLARDRAAAGAGATLPFGSPRGSGVGPLLDGGGPSGRPGSFARGEDERSRGGGPHSGGRGGYGGRLGPDAGNAFDLASSTSGLAGAAVAGSGMWSPRTGSGGLPSPRDPVQPPPYGGGGERQALRCYQCGEPGHFARECPQGAGPSSAFAGGGPPFRGYGGTGAGSGAGGGGGGGMTYAERQRERELQGLGGGGGGGGGGYGGWRDGEGGPGGSGGPKEGGRGREEWEGGRDGFARGFSSGRGGYRGGDR